MQNVFITVIGGLTLAFVVFLLNEFVFKKPNLTGEWKTTIRITDTSYKPFLDLSIEYKIHLLQNGTEFSGSGEKTKDIFPDGTETRFIPQKRGLLQLVGHFEKKYLRHSRIYLHVNEAGRIRETRATYSLFLHNKNKMTGSFVSTAANQKGLVQMIRS